jgi:Arm DNA-binding domain
VTGEWFGVSVPEAISAITKAADALQFGLNVLHDAFSQDEPICSSKRLTPRVIATLSKRGRHADGDRLYLVITKAGSKRWTFMYEFIGKQREAGFGSLEQISLEQARSKAVEFRSLIARGIDPLTRKL